MNINKNSWHFKVWKHFTSHRHYEWSGDANFCEYTRTVFVKAPVCCLSWVVIGTIIGAFQLIIAIPVMIVGWRPGFYEFWGADEPKFLVPYDGLHIPRKDKFPFELYPWHVLLPMALIAAQWALIHYNGWKIEAAIAACIAVVMGAAYLYENGDTETVRLLKAKAEAKHRMICPLITFTDEPTSTNPEE